MAYSIANQSYFMVENGQIDNAISLKDEPGLLFNGQFDNASSLKDEPGLLSNDLTSLLVLINFVVLCTGIGCFGVCTNTINITVFARQGFQDNINITLLALSCSDLGLLVTLMWQATCFNPLVKKATPLILTEEIQALTGGWPTALFSRTSGWLTAFLTAERCFCVLFPMKVKAIFTRRRTQTMIVAIFILVVAGFVPIFYCLRFGWKFVPKRNRTMLGLVFSDNWEQIRLVGSVISGVVSMLSCSVVVVASTVFLVVSLNRQTKWRHKTASTAKVVDTKGKTRTSNKEKAVIKMVISIAILFIIFLITPSTVTLPIGIVPELVVGGKYHNLLMVSISFVGMFSAINASCNIFIYHSMSSNYRSVFRDTFLKRCRQEHS